MSFESLTLASTHPEVHGRLPHQTCPQSRRVDRPDLWSSHKAWRTARWNLLPDHETDDRQQQQVLQCASLCRKDTKTIITKNPFPSYRFLFLPLTSVWVWSVGGSWCGCVQACSRPAGIYWNTHSASWSRGPDTHWLLFAWRGCRRSAGQPGDTNTI